MVRPATTINQAAHQRRELDHPLRALTPGAAHIAHRRGPKGKLLEAFEAASSLPKGQQEKLREVIDPMVQQFRRKTG